MTDTSPPAPVPDIEVPPEIKKALPPEIQAKLDAIRAQVAAEDAAAVQAIKDEEDRLTKLDAAKKVCFDLCGPISEAISQSTDPRERAALIQLETETHDTHKEMLENAYLESNGQRREEGNQAQPGAVTQLESHVSVLGDSSGDAQPV